MVVKNFTFLETLSIVKTLQLLPGIYLHDRHLIQTSDVDRKGLAMQLSMLTSRDLVVVLSVGASTTKGSEIFRLNEVE